MFHTRSWRAIVFCLTPLLFGSSCTCRGNALTEIEADDYVRSCSTNDDCMLAIDWNACDGCPPCLGSAINVSDRELYQDDLMRAERLCLNRFQCSIGCGRQAARCVDGVCGAYPQAFFNPPIMDQTCAEDSECMPVARGDACDPCTCSDDAVNVDASPPDYFASLDDLECGTPGPTTCAPCAEARAVCDDGQCALAVPP